MINSDNYHSEYTSITWANPIETLFCSAIDGKEHSLSIATEGEYKFNNNHRYLNDTNYIFRRFEIVPLEFLNDQFFDLKEGPYQSMSVAELKTSIDALSKNVSVKVDWQHHKEFYNAADTVLVRLHIQNRNAQYLPSKEAQQLFLSYHFYKDGALVEWEGVRTLPEVDLKGDYWQDIRVLMPEEAGTYQFVPDIVVEGKGWFNLNEPSDITAAY